MRRPAVVYAIARFGLFLVVAAVLWAGASAFDLILNGLPLLLLAMAISSVLSIRIFARQRAQLAESLQAKQVARAEQSAQRRERLENES